MTLYGATRQEIDEAREEAKDGCPLCFKKERRDEDPQFGGFLGDHDHKTNVFRGFLCRSCNMAMGYIDNADWMLRALAWQQRGR